MPDTLEDSATSERDYRLPRTAIPSRYDLRIAPDLDAGTFTGTVDVTLEVGEPVDEVVLNAVELDIHGCLLTPEDTPDGAPLAGTVELEADTGRARVRLQGTATPGTWRLHLSFRGTLNDLLRGFYRSTYTDADGHEHVLGATQFEATDARRAFPCWDEPDLKAVFAVTLVVPDGSLAVSNGGEVDRAGAGDGRVAITFADTIPMSTYLVAWVVGRLEVTDPVDVDGVPLRVVHVPGKAHLAPYALDTAAFCLRWFRDYYGLDYPGDKLDLIALPDFAAGAMENLGAITFREALVLVDPATVTQAELQRVADVIAHEVAHMWFGDLVTMRWWNGLWLNEAFATFMELVAVDAYQPQWRRWVSFSLERAVALDVDSLATTRPIEYPVHSPTDADGMFDVLTYQKGGSVLRMLEQYLGPTRFREGIRHYLRSRQFGNAETTDLWDAIEEATGEPVRRMMDSWVFQGGHPVVSVERDGDGLTLTQRRFRFAAGEEADGSAGEVRWSVPVMLRTGGTAVAPSPEGGRVLLEERSVSLPAAGVDYVVVNAGSHGFYRVRYSPELLAALASRAMEVLEPIERHHLVEDVWAAVLAGAAPATDFVDVARNLAAETDRTVWVALLAGLGNLERIVAGDDRARFHRFVASLAGPALDRLGWEPAAGDDELTRQLRGTLIEAAGVLGDDRDAQARARELHDTHVAEPGSVDPDVVAAALRVVAHAGSPDDYEQFLERSGSAATPQEQLRYLYALPGFTDAALAARTAAMTLRPDIRSQNAPFVLQALLANRNPDVGGLAWRFVEEHWDAITGRFPANTVPRFLGGVTALSSPRLATDIERFLTDHDVPHGARQIAQHLERLRINVALRAREAGRVADAVTGAVGDA